MTIPEIGRMRIGARLEIGAPRVEELSSEAAIEGN
jgi:hypothetical protein